MDPQIRSTLDSAPQAFGPFDAALRENEAALAELFGDAAAVEGVLTARIPALTALFPSMEKGLKALASVERDGKLGVTLILDSKATCAYDVDKQSRPWRTRSGRTSTSTAPGTATACSSAGHQRAAAGRR
jgi:hypothetical protein